MVHKIIIFLLLTLVSLFIKISCTYANVFYRHQNNDSLFWVSKIYEDVFYIEINFYKIQERYGILKPYYYKSVRFFLNLDSIILITQDTLDRHIDKVLSSEDDSSKFGNLDTFQVFNIRSTLWDYYSYNNLKVKLKKYGLTELVESYTQFPDEDDEIYFKYKKNKKFIFKMRLIGGKAVALRGTGDPKHCLTGDVYYGLHNKTLLVLLPISRSKSLLGLGRVGKLKIKLFIYDGISFYRLRTNKSDRIKESWMDIIHE